jgi:hypothetical protein
VQCHCFCSSFSPPRDFVLRGGGGFVAEAYAREPGSLREVVAVFFDEINATTNRILTIRELSCFVKPRVPRVDTLF